LGGLGELLARGPAQRPGSAALSAAASLCDSGRPLAAPLGRCTALSQQ